MTEQVTEDVKKIECSASGGLQLKVAGSLLEGSVNLKQGCRELATNKVDAFEGLVALSSGSMVGDDVAFRTQVEQDNLTTTCQYTGRVDSTKATIRGTVACQVRIKDVDDVLPLRGGWSAERMRP